MLTSYEEAAAGYFDEPEPRVCGRCGNYKKLNLLPWLCGKGYCNAHLVGYCSIMEDAAMALEDADGCPDWRSAF